MLKAKLKSLQMAHGISERLAGNQWNTSFFSLQICTLPWFHAFLCVLESTLFNNN